MSDKKDVKSVQIKSSDPQLTRVVSDIRASLSRLQERITKLEKKVN